MTATFRRVAEMLGWTPGQVWTVAVGFAVAVPAAFMGLGPTLATLRAPGFALPTPPAAVAAPAVAAPAAPPPILGNNPKVTPVKSGGTSAAGRPGTAEPPTGGPAVDDRVFATIGGTGTMRSIAVAADAVAVAVDAGPGAPGHVVVLDESGTVARDIALVVDDVPYQQPGGVAVINGAVLVTTTSPSAVVRVDPGASTVTKVADVPDVPVCIPVVQATNCQAAVPDAPPKPQQLALTDTGDLFIADRAQACIMRVANGESTASTWLCDASFAASPSANGAGGLAGVAAAEDRVVFTVAAGFDGNDSIQSVTVVNGAPADRRQLAAPPANSGTSGVAILTDGRIVTALTAANQLFVVAPDGSSSRSVDVDGTTTPVDVDALGDSLLIAQQSGTIAKRPLSAIS